MARKVRTPGGAEYYGQPIGTIITPRLRAMAQAKNGGARAPKGSTGGASVTGGTRPRVGFQKETNSSVAPPKPIGPRTAPAPAGTPTRNEAQAQAFKGVVRRTIPPIRGEQQMMVGKSTFGVPAGTKVFKPSSNTKVSYAVTPEGGVHVFTENGEMDLPPEVKDRVRFLLATDSGHVSEENAPASTAGPETEVALEDSSREGSNVKGKAGEDSSVQSGSGDVPEVRDPSGSDGRGQSGDFSPLDGRAYSSGSGSELVVGGRKVKTKKLLTAELPNSEEIRASGGSTPQLFELDPSESSVFHSAISELKKNNKFSASVHVYDEAEYKEMRLFMADDGKSGIALKDGEEIVSVFSIPGSKNERVGRHLVSQAVEEGGTRLDAYDTVLPGLYALEGFRPVARLDWNDEYSPDGWDKETYKSFNGGSPDVVFMALDPDSRNRPYDPTEGQRVDEYDKGTDLTKNPPPFKEPDGANPAKALADYDAPVTSEWYTLNSDPRTNTILKKRLAKLSAQSGIPEEELAEIGREELQKYVDSSEVGIQVTQHSLNKILKDGKFKSAHESGSSSVSDPWEFEEYKEHRSGDEELLFGKQTSAPIYGHVFSPDQKKDTLSQYGDITVVLKPSVRDRATISDGDSLDSFSGQPAPINSVSPFAVQWGNLNGGRWKGDRDKAREAFRDKFFTQTRYESEGTTPLDYMEAQIHGGVSADDISHFEDADGNKYTFEGGKRVPYPTGSAAGPTPEEQAFADKKKADQDKRVKDLKTEAATYIGLSRGTVTPKNSASLGESFKTDKQDHSDFAASPITSQHVDKNGKFTPEREALHNQIIESFLDGVKPVDKPTQYMNGGGPASGKGTMTTGENANLTQYPKARAVNDRTGDFEEFNGSPMAVLVDPDSIKMQLPEVREIRDRLNAGQGSSKDKNWAYNSYAESSYIASRLQEAALDRGMNVILDGTGSDTEAMLNRALKARRLGYSVEATYLYLDPKEGVRRATVRAQRTNREIPIPVIEKSYDNIPFAFETLKEGVFDKLNLFDNNVPMGEPSRPIGSGKDGTFTVSDSVAYQEFLKARRA